MEDTRQWDKILKVLKEKDNNQHTLINKDKKMLSKLQENQIQ